jgi:hypothetical protein
VELKPLVIVLVCYILCRAAISSHCRIGRVSVPTELINGCTVSKYEKCMIELTRAAMPNLKILSLFRKGNEVKA